MLSWRSAAECLIAIGSLVRILFFGPPRRHIQHGVGVSLINIFLRVPQVMWVCAYLCLVVVWFDMLSFIRRASTASRKRTKTGRKLKLTVLTIVIVLLLAEVALEVAAALAVPHVDAAANLLIGFTVLVMVLAAFRFSRRALRAVKYLSEVSLGAPAPDSSLGMPRGSSAASSSTSGSRGRLPSGDTRESLLNFDLNHPAAPSSAADMATMPAGVAPGGNSLAHRPAGHLGARSRSQHASRAVQLLFGSRSDDGSTVYESSSTGSVQEPLPLESSGSGPIRLERDNSNQALALGTGSAQQAVDVRDWEQRDDRHHTQHGQGSLSGMRGARAGHDTLSPLLSPAAPALQAAQGGEAPILCSTTCCMAVQYRQSSDPLLKLLARISTTTVAALVIGLVLFPTVAVMFAVPVNSHYHPWGYLAVQAIVFIGVEGSTASFLALSVWPQRDAPPAPAASGSPAPAPASTLHSQSRHVSAAMPIPEHEAPRRGPSAYFESAGAAGGGFSLPHVPSGSSMTANPSPQSGANSSSSALLARTAAMDRQASLDDSLQLRAAQPAIGSLASSSSRLRRDDSISSGRRLHSGSAKGSGLVLGSGTSVPSSLRSSRRSKR